MVVLEFLQRVYDHDEGRFVSRLEARVEVDGTELRVVDGDAEWENVRDVVVDDPERPSEDLTFESDPERWALAVSAAFRAGDVVAVAYEHVPAGEAGSTRTGGW